LEITLNLDKDTNQTEVDVELFKKIGLKGHLLESIATKKFSTPTEIQEQAIPIVLQGKDIIAQAQTGSGKTAAFAWPALQQMSTHSKGIHTLVLVPTRELAQQVMEEFRFFGRPQKIKTACIVGGESYGRQLDAIKAGAKVMVATPGRLLDLLNRKKIKDFKPSLVVLDEADEMLDFGFIDDIKTILASIPKNRQTLFFSATFPRTIANLARDTQVDPVHIKLIKDQSEPHANIEQKLYLVKDNEREKALIRLIETEKPEKAIIFCRTRKDTNELCSSLSSKNIQAHALNGDLSQNERNRIIQDFKAGRNKLLIATDVASRGLDVKDLTHVFNYQIPDNKDRYTHRIGRTGRAGEKGKALTLATKSECSSHRVFRQSGKNNFIPSEIASKHEVEKIITKRFVDEIHIQQVSSDVRKKCAKILKDQDHFEWFCKLYASTVDDKQVIGPDHIGLPVTEVKNALSSTSSSKSSSFSGGRRSGFRSSRRPSSDSNERRSFRGGRSFSSSSSSSPRGSNRRRSSR
jgi:ATP-dependent RNA helicase DeaD